jgi:glycosyltransferase involved in cell wall biosynthesis
VNSAVMSADEVCGGQVHEGVSGTSGRRLKLLLIAAGCDSAAVGEGWSSFQWVSRIARRHDVTLLTSRNSRRPTAPQLPGVRVIEWSDFRLFEKWERFNSMLKPSYVGFYVHARRWLKNRLRAGETFDLAHQISPLALRYPSPAAGLGVPLVLGPLGGSIDNPPAFEKELSRGAWYTKLRSMDEWRLRHDPWLRHSYAHADRIICVAPYVERLLGDLPSHELEWMSETGVTQLPPPRSSTRDGARRLRLLFVGRVIRSKGVRDAVRAIAKLSDLNGLVFDVVGDGDDLAACKDEARDLGVSDRVIFHGRLPRKEIDPFYATADVFVFPSFREPSGNVVLEAMSHGLAMVVADRGGPGFVVDDTCGFRIPVVDPKQFAEGIAACIRKLSAEPDLIVEMGTAARERVKRQFLWDAKVDRIVELYDRVLSKRETSNS